MQLVKISIFLLLLSLTIIGQTNKGSISGTVTDPKGLVVPGAKVTITNVGTNQAIVLTTSDGGAFAAHTLDPALYNVLVEAPNFKKSLIQKVKVDTAAVTTVNVAIEVGNVAEEVTIQADAQLVNSDSGTISQTITERQIRDLPLNNRSVLDLAVTMPNVSGDSGSEDIDAGFSSPSPGFNLSVNGGRPGSTSLLADGVNNTGIGIARAVVSFSPETVQEFSIQSSAYSAEFGTTGGGVINITTKSGANDFFGTALWYHRNPKTNARAWNQGTAPRPANNLRSNQASFTAGGPIFFPAFGEGGPRLYNGKNRSFFFVAVEPRWRNDFTQGVGLVPTAAERSGNFRGLVHTSSGWLPAAVATQFNVTPLASDTNIYQGYTLGAGSALIPIVVPAGGQFCPFGWVPSINGATQVTFNAQGQPYCTAAQAAAQIGNAANNPALNVIPAAFMDPASLALIQYMDPPGDSYFLDNGLVRNLFTLREAQQNETRYTVRLDHNFTEKIKGTFRWTKTPAVGVRGATGSDINSNTGVYSDAVQYLTTMNWIISPSMTNEARFNYTKGKFSEDYSPEFSIMGGRNISSDVGIRSLTAGGMPYLTGYAANESQYAGGDIGNTVSTMNFNEEKRWEISDTFYWTTGNMTWKIGGNISQAKLQVTPFYAASGGRWNFRRIQTNNSPTGANGAVNGGNALASMLIGVPNLVAFRPVLFTYNYQWDSYAGFVQNDWKVKPNLTINLGARYSVQMPRTEANNLQGVFRPDLAQTITYTDNGTAVASTQRGQIAIAAGVVTGAPIPSYIPTTTKMVPFAFAGSGGRSRNIVPVDWGAIEPRLGFAWSPKEIFGLNTEKYNLVLRGGFGVSHFPINGNNRLANPDFGGAAEPGPTRPNVLNANVSTGAQFPQQPFRLTGNNPVQGSTTPIDVLLGADANGLVFSKAIVIPGIAVDINDPDYGKVPYSQSWNFAIQFAPFKSSTLEIAYAANRGVKLYTPLININPRDTAILSTLIANNVNIAGNTADPLGRLPLLGGTTAIQVPTPSLFTEFMGHDPLNKYYNAKSSSIRHAGYVDFRRRISTGLSITANYTFAKSIDDSSDSSPDVRILTTGSARGQVALGGTLEGDRGLSVFDVKHAFSSTITYDLPFGKGRKFLKDAPWYVQGPFGGWSLSSVIRIVGGNPYVVFMTDSNLLGPLTRTVRPDIVSGVPLKNPLYDPGCRVGSAGAATGPAGCEPYINPAAFMRPPKGQLGNAPRTIDVRDPTRQYYDLSIQKDFPLGGDGKRKINFRVDALNVFNKPNFYFNNRGNQPFGWGGFPVEFNGNECISSPSALLSTCPNPAAGQPPTQRSTVISEADYTAWVNFSPTTRPAVNTPAGQALLGQIRTMVNNLRLPARPGQIAGSGALPDNFWSIPVLEGFATRNALSYDLTTLDGFRHWRLRNAYVNDFGSLTSGAIAFGSPTPGTSSRYIQFGIRLIF